MPTVVIPLFGITGSRSLNSPTDREFVFAYLDDLYQRRSPFEIIHGDCPDGGDRFAREWCEARNVVHHPLPGWPGKYFARNRDIVDLSHELHAFWDGTLDHGGTIYTIRYAVKRGKDVYDAVALRDGITREFGQ